MLKEFNKENLSAQIESLLFIHGEPLKISQLAEILETDEAAIIKAAYAIVEELKKAERGLILINAGGSLQLATKPELAPLVKKFAQKELGSELTPAALETISIVAYTGPISKEKIEFVRGVNSSYTIRNLLVRGLITQNKNLFEVSADLLRNLGLTDISQLPDYEKYKNLAQRE